ncbi:hypothetical protein GGP41_001314 [Bipolaris sorokiniana]|uniref:Aminotransferase class III n=1 Tax=Cochliobolus sativus TaxID=45130 RepID=A0A8H5ZC23_COCSA|nr:hypothetical protein GGP41_001314 [Bipolaris sorokiniana]
MSRPYDNTNIDQLQRDADDCLLTYGIAFHPKIITSIDGIYVETASGHRMMDFTSGQMSTLIGHGHPEVVNVVQIHAQHFDHLFSGMISPPVINLAKRLTSVAPPGLDKTFFLSTGGEGNEAATRPAKFFTRKFEIVGLAASWHGMTGASLGAQYHAGHSDYGLNMIGNLALPTPNSYHSIFRKGDGTYDWETELNYGCRRQCARSKRLSVKLQAELKRLQSRYGCIGNVRGRGLMAGVEIVSDRKTKASAPGVGATVSQKMDL